MKRIIAAILMAVMVFTMAGCSSEELGMYTTMTDIMNLDIIESSGNVSISMQGKMIDDMIKKAPKEVGAVKKVFDPGMEIRFTARQNKKTLEYEADIDFRIKGENDFKNLTVVKGNKKEMYIKMDDIFKFLKPYITETDAEAGKQVDELISKVEYIRIDLEEGLEKGAGNKGYSGTVQNEKVTDIFIGFMEVFKDALKDFSSGVVTKKPKGYEIYLEAKDLKPLIIKFLEYFESNVDTIFDKLAAKVNSLSEEDITALREAYADTSISKEKMLSSLEEMRKGAKENLPQEIETFKTNPAYDMVLPGLQGTSCRYYLGKLDNESYEASNDIKIRFQDMMSIDIIEKVESKRTSNFSISKPENSVNQEEFKAIVESVIPPSVLEMRIKIPSGETQLYYTNGKTTDTKIGFIQKDGFTYLSYKVINDTFGEDIKWDSTKNSAAAAKEGTNVYLEGLAEPNNSYIWVKELAKLGYLVSWDDWSQEVVIIKPNINLLFK